MITEVQDDRLLADFFRSDPFLHLYSLGDLDPFFRSHARWWGLWETENAVPCLRDVVLIYDAGSLPVLLAFGRDPGRLRALLAGIREQLPARFYAHVSPEAEVALAGDFRLESNGMHLRMGLIDQARLVVSRPALATPEESNPIASDAAAGKPASSTPARTKSSSSVQADSPGPVVLSRLDLTEVLELFAASYPGNWFDPRMLETKQYVGVRVDGRLAAIAGVHVFSPSFRVAAVGNITTRPAHRGKGLARLVTGALCRQLLENVDWIGLNVHAENAAAIACYRGLGFARVADYEEYMVERRG